MIQSRKPVLEQHGQRGVALLRQLRGVADGVLGHRELAGQAHQRVDASGIDAQRPCRRLRIGR
jgi:hypothetical protein